MAFSLGKIFKSIAAPFKAVAATGTKRNDPPSQREQTAKGQRDRDE
jgi:hypothetical protein